jgi:glycosyltransferase involved in cell wall biosynthesis
MTTIEQAEPWVAAGLLRPFQISQVVESSSPFFGIARDEARTRTGMHGDPIYLSAGRLDPIKDPLTMLRGFEQIAAHQSGARPYLYYLTDEMMPEVAGFLGERPMLADRVELRGRVPLDQMEAVYSSADFLLQASLREWSGLAVIEAMSCGCIPIVSDIPSFRMLTADGTVGKLFAVGDSADLASAALSISIADRARLSQAARLHVAQELSFAAMAAKISAVYCELRPDLVNSHQQADFDSSGRVQYSP